MPIPAFDGILSVLPPHLGDPRLRADLSPYPCTMEELCDRFATTPERKVILSGLISIRAELRILGIRGQQWISGSFVEDIETLERRNPNDVDVVTIVSTPGTPDDLAKLIIPREELWNPAQSKPTFHVDHYLMSYASDGQRLLDDSRYWYALFSHRRDKIWKGMLMAGLADGDDTAASQILSAKP